jgi:hypothetical protein
MPDIFLSIFFGWPALLLSVVLAVIGLWKTRFPLVVGAAIAAFAPFWFLSGFPIVASPLFLVPLLLLASAFALSRGHEMIAWLLGILYFSFVALLLYAVIYGK